MTMRGVLGVDAGGTRTVCAVADLDGRVVSLSRSTGANLQSLGAAGVESVLGDLIATARAQAPGLQPEAICLGMAGVDRPSDAVVIEGIASRLVPGAQTVVVNDALIALEAGLPGAPGVVLISGTGSIAFGRNASGRAARAGGWGYVLGDEGSGYWLGRQALRSVVRFADGRGEETLLTQPVLAHYGVTVAGELVQKIAAEGPNPSGIAQLAKYVGAAAQAGDQMARDLITEAAADLALAAASVARRLLLNDPAVLLAGGTLLGVGELQLQTSEEITRRLARATTRVLEAEPVMGAVRLALEVLGGRLRIPQYEAASRP